MHLSRRQRESVQYFKKFTVTDTDVEKPKIFAKIMDTDRIIRECEPSENREDRRIVYEMTGIEISVDEFASDSSYEIDPGALVDLILGVDGEAANGGAAGSVQESLLLGTGQ